jgi:hypothetical protein
MKLYLIRPRSNVDAIAEYNLDDKKVTVLKGSRVSNKIAYSEKFRGAKSVEKARANAVEANIVVKDMTFKSPSTAANFVTGASTNGLSAWKNKEGKTLKSILTEMEGTQ